MIKKDKKQTGEEIYFKWKEDIEKLMEKSSFMSWSSIEKKSGYDKLSEEIKENSIIKDIVHQVQNNCITYMGLCEAIKEMKGDIESSLTDLTKEEYDQAFDFLTELMNMQDGAEIVLNEEGNKVAQLSKKQIQRLEEMHNQSRGFKLLDAFLKNIQTVEAGKLNRIERQIDSFEKSLKVAERFLKKQYGK